MSNEQPPTDPRAKIRPLESVKADGTQYGRSDNVLDCIARYQGLPESIRISDVPEMPSEALVYFIREADRNNRAFYDRLFRELIRRAAGVIHKTTRGLDSFDARDLSLGVEARVMKLI